MANVLKAIVNHLRNLMVHHYSSWFVRFRMESFLKFHFHIPSSSSVQSLLHLPSEKFKMLFIYSRFVPSQLWFMFRRDINNLLIWWLEHLFEWSIEAFVTFLFKTISQSGFEQVIANTNDFGCYRDYQQTPKVVFNACWTILHRVSV